MEKGCLVFELRKDNGAEPIIDAQVKIISIDGREVNRLLKVNDDGKTDEIEVYTKDSRLTFNQLNREIPYTRIDAEVKLGNDKIMEIDDIQVYSNITSIQEVKLDSRVTTSMRHHKDKKGKGKKEHIYIKNENPCIFNTEVNVKDKDEILKDDKSLKSIVKVEELYIPQFITIHLGEVGEEGETLTVPFIDYVKNVACSTIYPTWNEEAIKANIYAIVSFALNRVYTNWYRSKGYGFQITSSKIHDQMYVKGRTLFKNVCDMVDDMFDKCIKLEGFYQPLLSRCENTTMDYKILSRWGSLSLAEDGLFALDILKKYFGDTVQIVDVPKIECVMKKCPNRELFHGVNNDDVRFLQKALNMISSHYKGISKIGSITGYFGDETERAVRDFQRIFNLKVDGIVGSKTWKKICIIYAIIKQLYHNDELEEIAPEFKTLQYGQTGEDIEVLQKDLNNILRDFNNYTQIKEDGIFGQETEKAVKFFQRVFGLNVDGIAGKNTMGRIEYAKEFISDLKDLVEYHNQINSVKDKTSDMNSIIESRHSSEDLSKINNKLPIKMGDSGEHVYKLQKYLNRLSRYYGFLHKIKEDGIFGRETEDMVKKFQKYLFLTVDGIFGEKSFLKLQSIMEIINHLYELDPDDCKTYTNHKHNDDEYKNVNFEIIYPKNYIKRKTRYLNDIKISRPLTKGVEGEDVKLVQSELNKLISYYGGRLLNVNGKYDDETEESINKFKQKLGLPVTGYFDEHDFDILMDINNNIEDLGYLSVKICKDDKCKIHVYYPKSNGMTNYEVIYPDLTSEFDISKYSNISSYPMNMYNQFIDSTSQYNQNQNSNGGFIELDTGIPPNFEGSAYYSNKDFIINSGNNQGRSNIKDGMFIVDFYRDEEDNLNIHNFRGEYSMPYPNFDLEYGCISGYVTLAQKYINTIKENNKGYFRNNVFLLEDGIFGDNTLLYVREIQDKFRCPNQSKIDKTVWNRLILEYEKIFSK